MENSMQGFFNNLGLNVVLNYIVMRIGDVRN